MIYDEAKGDADSGLAPGTRFDDIPDDWACPRCGVTKADFEPYEHTAIERRAAPARPHVNARDDAGVVIVGLSRTHAVNVSTRANTLRTTRGSLRYRHFVLAHGAVPAARPG